MGGFNKESLYSIGCLSYRVDAIKDLSLIEESYDKLIIFQKSSSILLATKAERNLIKDQLLTQFELIEIIKKRIHLY